MQQLNPSEISDIIRQRIDQLDIGTEARNQGPSFQSPTASSAYMA